MSASRPFTIKPNLPEGGKQGDVLFASFLGGSKGTFFLLPFLFIVKPVML
jgi:hypothetical protein